MARKSDIAKRSSGVVLELGRLLDAVREGRLDERANPGAFDGEDAEILRHANTLVDELVRPLRIAAGSLSEIAAGKIPEFVIDPYQGEFDTIKRNINTFLATMQGLHHEARDLINAITAGQLHARGNEEDFQGTWRELIAGMNGVVDAFERPFQIASTCVLEITDGKMPPPIRRGLKGDYGRLARNLNILVSTVQHMTSAVVRLSQSAVAGRLDQRIAQDEFTGDWQSLVRGINETLDSALAPINEAGQILERLAAYDLRARVQGDYAGDHAQIKNALNLTAETLNQAMIQVSTSARAVAQATERIVGTAQEVTTGTQRQVSAVGQITDMTTTLVDKANGNAALSEDALERAGDVNTAVGTGKAGVERVAAVMSEVVAATDASTAVMQEIDAIAAQTDALAVTANSEAGKVASSGRGFAVVADEVRRLARQSKDAANKMDLLLGEVAQLLKVSRQQGNGSTCESIASVVQEIQQIAFQTNMLAVNAAVEAAHVGAASAGFESITTEIRGLALRVKGAAERTRTLTQGAHSAAEGGQEIAIELNQDFSAIVRGVSSMTESIGVIASATTDQQSSMRAMAEAMRAIRDVTDNNARSAKDSAAVAGKLTSETASLARLVDRFKLEENAAIDVAHPSSDTGVRSAATRGVEQLTG